MKQLTIFTAPKPFVDPHVNVIQRNAIRSWQQMGPEVEILLIGDEAGIAETAKELGVDHLKGVVRNEQGTPLVSSMFHLARRASHADLMLFTNTDILFYPETLQLALNVKKQMSEFVLLGQRHDLKIEAFLDFTPGWDSHLREDVKAHGQLHPQGGSDYFLFPRPLFADIPDFAIGRAGWDNWMIYHAVTQPWLAIDATSDLSVVHQNHDYSHLAGGRGHQRHPETFANTVLAGGMRHIYMLLDVDHRLVNGHILPVAWTPARFLRSLERGLQSDELVGRGLRWPVLRLVRKLRRAFSHGEVG